VIIPIDAAFHILIVDDCTEDRTAYKRYLSQSQSPTYECSEAETIEDGFKRFRESLPDCVLLDYRLPDGNGLDFLELASSEFLPHKIRVVMLAGLGDEDVIVNAMKKGAMDYMSKGRLSADVLCRTVYKVIEKGALLYSLHERQLEKDRLIIELQEALAQVKALSGLLPICASCKKIRDDRGYWNQIESYISEHSEATFSHGLCEVCADKLYGQEDWYRKRKKPDNKPLES
jgi:DNA-binding NarL/FixJ family response regulator